MLIGKSVISNYRENNEDSYSFAKVGERLVLAVADGMGGAPAGEVASKMAVEYVMEGLKKELPFIKSEEELKYYLPRLFNQANVAVLRDCIDHPERIGMGTTLTVAVVLDQRLVVCHIGDSRAYIVKKNDVIKLTNDHNYAAELVRQGKMTEEQALKHSGRAMLEKLIGENRFLSPDVYSYNISCDDIILLCSDGFYSWVNKDEIIDIVANEDDEEKICDKLIDKALSNDCKDNATVVVAKV